MIRQLVKVYGGQICNDLNTKIAAILFGIDPPSAQLELIRLNDRPYHTRTLIDSSKFWRMLFLTADSSKEVAPQCL